MWDPVFQLVMGVVPIAAGLAILDKELREHPLLGFAADVFIFTGPPMLVIGIAFIVIGACLAYQFVAAW